MDHEDRDNEDDRSSLAEAALAAEMQDPFLSRSTYYDICSHVNVHCWAFEWVHPKPQVLSSCCLVPTIGGIGLIGGRLSEMDAEVVVSIGSGAGLVEWLLAPRFDSVVCVDNYSSGFPQDNADAGVCLLPQAHADDQLVAVNWKDVAALQAAVGAKRLALLLCWPQLQPSTIESYISALASTPARLVGLLVIVGENCWPPDPRVAATSAGCCSTPLVDGGEEVKCLSEPCWAWAFAAHHPALEAIPKP